MARKRNHKAEYAARKAKAQALGYSGVSEYRKTRKALAIPRTRRTPSKRAVVRYRPAIFPSRDIARIRRENELWSKAHSHISRSRYRPEMSDEQARAYNAAYVKRVEGMSRRKAAKQKRRNIFDYLVEYDYIEEQEWHEDWKSNETAV